MSLPPPWLHTLAVVSLVTAFACALAVTTAILAGRRQRMWIMNLVWPITCLWSGPVGLAAFWVLGQPGRGARVARHAAHSAHAPERGRAARPSWRQVAVAATHCGSGCTLGDLVAESLAATWAVSVLGSRVLGTWLIDFGFAFAFGIAFQYFTIAPMRGRGPVASLKAALKADSASLVAWQLGMYGGMAVALFAVYSPAALPKSGPVFWFAMQLAMCAGFLTSYPVNAWLLRRGVKEAM